MSGWDDEGDIAVKVPTNWDDEDVPDSWDAELETEAAVSKKPTAPKLTLAQKIAQREEARRKEKEEKLKEEADRRKNQDMTELDRQRLAEAAEADLMESTFGGGAVAPAPQGSIDSLKPETQEQFDQLHELLKKKFKDLENSPLYSTFAQSLIRDIIPAVNVDNLRTISTLINALVVEKQKTTKSKNKKKGKTKNLVVERPGDYNYEPEVVDDDYDDFM